MRKGLFLLLIILPAFAVSAKPLIIQYSAFLTDANKKPRSLSYKTVYFRLYSESSGSTAFWEDNFVVTTSNGFANVSLGSGKPLPIRIIDTVNALWLEMEIAGEQAYTRQQIATSFYSIAASFADTSVFSDRSKRANNSDSLASRPASEYSLGNHTHSAAHRIDSSGYADTAAYARAFSIPAAGIATQHLQDSAVTAAKLARGAVTANNLPASKNGDFEVVGLLSADSIRFRSPKKIRQTILAGRALTTAYKVDKTTGYGISFGNTYSILPALEGAQVNSTTSGDTVALFLPIAPPPGAKIASITFYAVDLSGSAPDIFGTLMSIGSATGWRNYYLLGQGVSSKGTTTPGAGSAMKWTCNINVSPDEDYYLQMIYEGIDNSKTSFLRATLEYEIATP